MPLPRLLGLGVEKILFAEQFVCEAVANFLGFCMEGGDECLRLLGCANGTLGLDSDDGGVRCGCFRSPCSLLGTVSGDVSLLIASEAKSALYPLSLFLVREHGASSGASDVHGVWVSVVKRIPPLEFCCSSSSISSLDSLFEIDVFLLMAPCRLGPIVPRYWMIELDAVCH